MATSPSSVFEVVPNADGKARTGYAALVDSDGNDLPAVSFAQAAFVDDSPTDTAANVAAKVDELRDALVTAGIMAAS
jgi:hypothetical protein